MPRAGLFPIRAASSFSIIARYADVPGVELFHDAERAGAQAARHLLEVLRRHLPHRAIELQLLDRPQRQRLLALEIQARALAERLRGSRSACGATSGASIR